ncbi:hypothetical protein EPN18_03890 [bacterium]|nr:MAG: hypothetical protein EPN18_03890 [bacterium]
MSDVLRAMVNKGFKPLAGSRYGAIGIKRLLSPVKETQTEQKWFYSGTHMPDGTPITISARGEVQIQQYLDRGFLPFECGGGVKGRLADF